MTVKVITLAAFVVTALLVLAFFFLGPLQKDPGLHSAPLPSSTKAQTQISDNSAHASPEGVVRGVDAPAARTTLKAPDSAQRLRGRVIEDTSGRAIPGFHILVEGTAVKAVSDAEGRFILDLEGEDHVTLLVHPPPGWAVDIDRHPISAEILRRGDEVVLRAVRVSMGAWSFILVDEATDEPVPSFAILAETEEGVTAELVSDEDGIVIVDGEQLAGRLLTLRCRDHPVLSAQWASVPPISLRPPTNGALRQRVGIPVGPTYYMNIEGISHDELGTLRAVITSQASWHPTSEPGSHGTPVRTDGGWQSWVRFGPFDETPGPGPPWILAVSKEPNLSGEVEVHRVRGIHPGVLDVRLEGVGAIQGRAWNTDDDLPIVGASVMLIADDGNTHTVPDLAVPTAKDGTFRFPTLRAGRYLVGLVAGGYPSVTVTLEVLPGETSEHEFRLSPTVLLGQVSGTLTSVSRRSSMPVRLVLAPLDGGVSFYHDVKWEERDESTVAPFAFDDVPYGEYRLSLIPTLGFLWEPMAMDVRCPAEGLAFLCRDDIEPIPFHIRAFDALTQKELPEMWVFVETRIGGEVFTSAVLDHFVPGAPVGTLLQGRATVDWVVGAPGFTPIRGDASSMVEVSKPWGLVLEADVHLERGWGMLLEVLELQRDGRGPAVVGADVHADGTLLGRTGNDGRLLLTRSHAPKRLNVTAATSSVAWAEPFDDEGLLLSTFMIYGRVWIHQ